MRVPRDLSGSALVKDLKKGKYFDRFKCSDTEVNFIMPFLQDRRRRGVGAPGI